MKEDLNRGELCEVVVSHDRDLKPGIRLFGKGDGAGVVRRQLRRQSDVFGYGRMIESSEVLLIHAAEEILEDVVLNI